MAHPSYIDTLPDSLIAVARNAIIATSIVGILLGLIALFWPGATLLVVAVLFGIALIVTGVFRLAVAIGATVLPGGVRILYGALGLMILVLGVVALFSPGQSLVFLAIFIGVGWILDGIHSVADHRVGTRYSPRWLVIASGVLSIVAGIVVLALPALSIVVFLRVAAILLLVLSIASLVRLPRKSATA